MARSERTTRRRVLASLGAGTAVVLGGCSGAGDDPTYEDGEVDATGGDPRTAGEMVAAEAVASQEATEAATPLDALALAGHEFVVQDGYKGPTVQGTVANDGDDRLELAEVRVRVYDDAGAQLGRYLDSTGDFAAGATWRFEVVLLESVADIADYDIAVLGIPT